MLGRLLAGPLVFCLFLGSAAAQTPQAAKIRQQVGRIGILGNLTVYARDGRQYSGTVRGISAADFTINEVDQQREITLRYEEVTKVRSGYGTTRNIRGQRIHPRTKLTVTLSVVGGLLALVFIAVLSDHS